MSRERRLGLLAVGAAIAVVGFALAGSLEGERGEGGSTTGAARTIDTAEGAATTPAPRPARPKATRIRVRDGRPVGGVASLRVNRGKTVRFTVSSDVAEEVHVHGYDLSKDVAAGGSARFAFAARLEGIYEVELEHSQVQIARIEVRP